MNFQELSVFRKMAATYPRIVIIKMNVLKLANNKIVKNDSQYILLALIQQINKANWMKDCYVPAH
jgi:hypothetical protein